MHKNQPTKTLFVVSANQIVAVFPDDRDNIMDTVRCYTTQLKQGTANPSIMTREMAVFEAYKGLYKELRGLGYNPTVLNPDWPKNEEEWRSVALGLAHANEDHRPVRITDSFRKMGVGDEIKVPQSKQTWIYKIAENVGIKVKSEKVDPKTIRVWRIA